MGWERVPGVGERERRERLLQREGAGGVGGREEQEADQRAIEAQEEGRREGGAEREQRGREGEHELEQDLGCVHANEDEANHHHEQQQEQQLCLPNLLHWRID